jgi:hypothetical protein
MNLKGHTRGQMGLIINVFVAGFLGFILAIAIQQLYTQSRGNFTGLVLTVADNFMPVFMLLLIAVPIAGVLYIFGGKGR